MSFIFSLILTLLPLSLAAPSIQVRQLAPIILAAQVGASSTNGKHIVALKPGAVNATQDARLDFIAVALASQNIPLSGAIRKSLILDWKRDVFDGFAGVFSPEAVRALQQRTQVEFIQEG